jgi:hypothetical protein
MFYVITQNVFILSKYYCITTEDFNLILKSIIFLKEIEGSLDGCSKPKFFA